MTLIGKVLAGRYEILEEVGSGGMAVVYKARCQLLNRFVAVKVLRPDLQNDEEFVRRFNVEAQAAASLTHPNIVSIYDVGYESGFHYIVMEYIEGKTLKDYIEEKKILPWREAAEYAVQIAKGLEQAHKNSIIHRDVKPHNIIMTSDGVMKVTDFGIARANVQSTVTCEDSAIGSVHYISPEQARGGYTDVRSDIYSLGVVLYEMLTGKVPFDSERPVTVAIMHLQEKPVMPREHNISIPLSLERIVIKAMSKEVSARYNNISEMIAELNSVINDPSRGLFHVPDDDMLDSGAEKEDLGVTKKMPAVKITPIVPADLIPENNENYPGTGKSGTSVVPIDDTGYEGEKKELKKKASTSKKKYTVDKKKEKKVIMWAIISAIVVVLGLFGFAAYAMGFFDGCSSAEVPAIPNVVGKNYEEVVKEYADSYDPDSEYRFSFVDDKRIQSDKPEGTILEQDPEPGTKVSKGDTPIYLTISGGSEKIKLDDYTKEDKGDAREALYNLGLKCEIVEETSDRIPKDRVIRQEPMAGAMVDKGAIVTLYVSIGEDTSDKRIKIENYIGRSDRSAIERELENKGLKAVFKEEYSDTYAEGKICRQTPDPGRLLEEGERVTLYVSLGKEPEEPEDPEEPENPEEPQERKKMTWLSIKGPSDKESALVEVKVDGKLVHSVILQSNETKTIKLESTSSTVSVEILYDGVSQGVKNVTLH